MKNYIKIENDCFYITERLREIDESYFVLYNLDKKCYEIHSNEQKDSYCFSVPFNELDERTIDFAFKTRKENGDKIIDEIERNNLLVYQKSIKNQVEMMKEALCK